MPETALEDALNKAEQLRKMVRERNFTSVVENKEYLRTSLSIGVSSVGDGINTEEQLLRDADESLYKAKHLGRNRVCSLKLERQFAISDGAG
jgi:diguanylate cyclase